LSRGKPPCAARAALLRTQVILTIIAWPAFAMLSSSARYPHVMREISYRTVPVCNALQNR